jgi:hypothetical protein
MQPKNHVAPEDAVAFNLEISFVRSCAKLWTRSVATILMLPALVGTAAVLAHDDPAQRTALACHLVKTAVDLDADALEARWN